MRTIDGTLSAYPERTFGGYYLDFDIDREAAARYGLTTGDVQDVIQSAIGGMNVTTTVEGLERYPLNVRYARELRDDIAGARRRCSCRRRPARRSRSGSWRRIEINPGPPMIRSENGAADRVGVRRHRRAATSAATSPRPSAWSREQVALPAGYTLVWSGQFEYLRRPTARLAVVDPDHARADRAAALRRQPELVPRRRRSCSRCRSA